MPTSQGNQKKKKKKRKKKEEAMSRKAKEGKKKKKKRKMQHLGIGMAIGQGGVEGWSFHPCSHSFVLPHLCPVPPCLV